MHVLSWNVLNGGTTPFPKLERTTGVGDHVSIKMNTHALRIGRNRDRNVCWTVHLDLFGFNADTSRTGNDEIDSLYHLII